jgi:hypothetical protein
MSEYTQDVHISPPQALRVVCTHFGAEETLPPLVVAGKLALDIFCVMFALEKEPFSDFPLTHESTHTAMVRNS